MNARNQVYQCQNNKGKSTKRFTIKKTKKKLFPTSNVNIYVILDRGYEASSASYKKGPGY